MPDQPRPIDYVDELRREASKIVDAADQAGRHLAQGEPEKAALVLGLLHYTFAAAEGAGDAAMRAISEQHGVGPDDALRQMRGG